MMLTGKNADMSETKKRIKEDEVYEGPVRSSRRIIKGLKAKADARRTLSEKFADWVTSRFGSVNFLLVNALWFTIWVVINLGLVPEITPFDPFPFGLLTMIVSLEAIVLAIFVLISQNRAARIDDLREEVDLQVDIITEEEVTKLLELQVAIAQKNGIDTSKDKELQRMLRPMNTNKIEKALQHEIVL